MVIRTGLIGHGLAGAVFHEPLIRASRRLELAAVLTSRAHLLKVESLDDLLGRSDLVVIASPNQTHFPLAKAALEANRHVVVDKPFTVTTDEADELIAIADARNLVLSVFHNRRWDGDFLTLQRIIPELGEILLFEANWDRFRPAIKQGWREDPAPGAGILNDLGPHLLDQALKLFGMPEAIGADIEIQREGARVDDYFDIVLQYRAMRACLRSSSVMAAPRPRFAVHGTKGSFIKHGLDPQEAQLKAGERPADPGFGRGSEDGTLVLADGSLKTVPTRRGNYPAFYEGIAEAILEGAPPPVAPADARDGVLLINLARRASALWERLPVLAASSLEG
jgi:scyllo-inositol 2-dehydrogenase (NADP+)